MSTHTEDEQVITTLSTEEIIDQRETQSKHTDSLKPFNT